ncbi:MAG: FHA domain-containing protein [Anaerolineales bacterium]|nr:FHA domain-containing protein [Anaerolineales bacterium]
MDTNSEEYPLLIGQTGPLKGQRWTLSKPLMIGREATCDVVVSDRQVSRFHARLMPSPNGIVLEDLGSKNGTHCNGTVVTGQVTLQDGDMVQIAVAQSFLFLTSDATMPLTESDARPGRLRLDLRARRVWVSQQQIDPPLSALQFRVLQTLVDQQGQVIDRQQLIAEAWGDEQSAGVSDQALDALLRRLRDRIAAIDPSHAYIVTVRGHGLRLDNPPAD